MHEIFLRGGIALRPRSPVSLSGAGHGSHGYAVTGLMVSGPAVLTARRGFGLQAEASAAAGCLAGVSAADLPRRSFTRPLVASLGGE
jgi:hypothetical protein